MLVGFDLVVGDVTRRKRDETDRYCITVREHMEALFVLFTCMVRKNLLAILSEASANGLTDPDVRYEYAMKISTNYQ